MTLADSAGDSEILSITLIQTFLCLAVAIYYNGSITGQSISIVINAEMIHFG